MYVQLAAAKEPACVENDPTSLCAKIWDATGISWLADWSDWLIAIPLTIIGIIIAAIVLRWVVKRLIRRITHSTANSVVRTPEIFNEAAGFAAERRQQRAQAIGSILGSASTAIIFTVAIILILEQLHFNLAVLLTSAGIAGIALGFGAQSLVKDVLAGIFILAEDQYGVGDVIDAGEASGTVEAVGLRITTLRDVSGVVWHVRNGEIIRVGNKSQGWAQVIVDVPLPYGTDVDAATVAVRNAADELADDPEWNVELLAEPEVWGVEQLTPNGMLLRVAVKTSSESQWKVARHLRERINGSLDAAEIQTGFPALETQRNQQSPKKSH